jgi:SAM-dependent methyltransferase
MLDVLEELREPVRIHRKAWEYGKSLHGLDRLGAIRRDAQGVSIGAGAERPLFYLANHVDRITATDLYESQAEPWGWGSDFLRDPGAYAPFPFRSDGLVVRNMSGLELEFPSSSLDFVYTLSSIEHFGGHEAARTAMQEMARVTKPGGVVCVVTELVLSQESAPELFTIDGLREYLVHGSDLKLADSHIDLRISESLLAHPVHLVKESDLVSPHIVLTGWGETGAVWTSVILFFRK